MILAVFTCQNNIAVSKNLFKNCYELKYSTLSEGSGMVAMFPLISII